MARNTSPPKRVTGENPRTTRIRDIVLPAVIELLLAEGAGAVTALRVSEQAGVARSTIYQHWPDPQTRGRRSNCAGSNASDLVDKPDSVLAGHSHIARLNLTTSVTEASAELQPAEQGEWKQSVGSCPSTTPTPSASRRRRARERAWRSALTRKPSRITESPTVSVHDPVTRAFILTWPLIAADDPPPPVSSLRFGPVEIPRPVLR